MRDVARTAVAHVHEEAAGKWWRFDDETVTPMPQGPIGEKADHGVAANPAATGKKVCPLSKGRWDVHQTVLLVVAVSTSLHGSCIMYPLCLPLQ